jgi:hypothetical protein
MNWAGRIDVRDNTFRREGRGRTVVAADDATFGGQQPPRDRIDPYAGRGPHPRPLI